MFVGAHPGRRAAVLATAFLLLALGYLLLANPFVSATSGGDPYTVPLVQDTNPDPNIIETSLTAEVSTVDLGHGVVAKNAMTFNGQIPGPTFKLKLGNVVIVHFHNHLPFASGIHWHGAELANAMDGTPFTQNMVPPGGNFVYKFTANRPGIFWYHPHHHSSTNQIFKGLYGMILVEDPNESKLQASGTLPPQADTVPLVLSDTTVCKKPGENDALTYPLGLPHVSGGALPAQEPPTPKNLCEGPAVGANPYPVDENGSLRGPYAAGEIPAIQTAAHAGRVNEGQTVLTNGKNVGGRAGSPTNPEELEAGASVMTVQPGQGVRLQILNAATTRYFRLILTSPEGTQIPLIRVGGEGGLLNNAVTEGGTEGTWITKYSPGEILLPPGSRADVVAAIPTAPKKGVLTLWTEDYERTGKAYSDLPTVPVMHMALAGPTVSPAYTITGGTELRSATGNLVETLPAPKPGEELLNPATFTPPKLGLPNKVIKFTSKAQTELGVDEVFGTHDVEGDYGSASHLGSTRYVKSGDTIELELKNVTGANHPFHLHGMSIQPISLSNGAETFTWPYPEFRDNVDVPGGFTLKFRVRIDPRPLVDGVTPGGEYGRWLFHCHIVFHSEDGMLSELVVTGPEGNERPNVNVDNSELTANPGEAVSMKGTYNDPDEDPVSLSSSQGNVVNRGGGQYTWNFTTGANEGSHLVYITATDSHGLKDQIPLYLKINPTNGPPANRKPVLKRLRVVPKKFAPAKSFTKLKRAAASKGKRGGAKITFNISEAARVKFTIKRMAPRRPKVKVPAFSRAVKSGGNKVVRFSGRFKRTGAMKPGKYKLTARATDSGGLKSNQLSTSFKIVR